MNELLQITYDNDRPTVSGRALHKALDIKTPYHKWFARMREYGFTDGVDFMTVDKNVLRADGTEMPQIQHDHQLTIDMAKELCMIQRTEKGKQCRQYFLEIEKRWNSPTAIMARALQLANRENESLKHDIETLTSDNAALLSENTQMKPKADYYDLAMNSKATMTATELAASLGLRSAQKLNRLLCSMGIQRPAKCGGYYVLTAKYADCGYAVLNQKCYGTYGVTKQLRFTQKGRKFIYDLLVENGVIEPDVVHHEDLVVSVPAQPSNAQFMEVVQ